MNDTKNCKEVNIQFNLQTTFEKDKSTTSWINCVANENCTLAQYYYCDTMDLILLSAKDLSAHKQQFSVSGTLIVFFILYLGTVPAVLVLLIVKFTLVYQLYAFV